MARILLLEDDLDQLEFRALLLEREGHEIRKAATVAEAIVRSTDCDVAIVDLLPGVEQLVFQLPAATRVVVLSGREAVDDSVKARSAVLLRKPCPTRQLIETIARLTWTS